MAEAIGGYDFEFIEDIPDDLTCTLCHYALKNPVQIEDCGHTFCEDCFNRTKDHASANALEFCCPLDRQVIDIGRVFKNKADERKVLNLKVKCRYFEDDCEWIGELRNALEHESKCSKNKTIIDKTSEVELKQLLNRMAELESKLQANEENVKINVKKLAEKDRQIENQNQQIENQSKQIENQNKQIENQNKQVEMQNKQMENRNTQMENQSKQIKDLKVQVENQSKEIVNLQKSQTTMIKPNIEDNSNFTSLSTAFQWKFDPVSVRASRSRLHSPPFYNVMNSHCFQLGVDFVNNNYQVILFRYRGKYDDTKDFIKTTQSFDFSVHIFGKKGKQKVLTFINEDHSIPKFKERNDGLCHRINNCEIASMAVDGYIHLHCFFK